MKKVIKVVMITLCFFLSGALCNANGKSQKENKQGKGIPIVLVASSSTSEPSRGNSIQAILNGHWLSVVFLENLGQVYIEISEVGNGETQVQSTPTPNGVDFFITCTGNYIITFTLANGDEYYGEFQVTD